VTVILAIMCADGVVIAADSQITDSDRDMSFPGQKLHHPGDHAAWVGSGARGVLTDLEKALDEVIDAARQGTMIFSPRPRQLRQRLGQEGPDEEETHRHRYRVTEAKPETAFG
jgi:20S proteasome alpha/beta subunit